MYVVGELIGFPQAARRLERALDDELERAARRGGEIAAESAKQTHPFTNRSHALQDSIKGVEPEGRFTDGDLEMGLEATAPYASYVNDRPEFEFLQLGYLLVQSDIERELEAAVDRATDRAGWT